MDDKARELLIKARKIYLTGISSSGNLNATLEEILCFWEDVNAFLNTETE
jgi:DNA-binding MurR/RpiR family transcriptional regulator